MKIILNKIFLSLIIIHILQHYYSYIFSSTSSYFSIAHRGASAYAPENTMAAFHRAYELGYDFIEFDVRMSKDKELVIIHDETVNRTTDGFGYVHEMTIEELKSLDAGSWFDPIYEGEKIPLLSEVFEQLGEKIGLLIEIKATPNHDEIIFKVADFIRNKLNEGYDPSLIQVQSFVPKHMQLFASLIPELKIGIIIKDPIHLLYFAKYRNFASFLAIHYQYLSKSLIQTAKMLDYEIYTWTIKHPSQFYMIEHFPIHGIISNISKENFDINE